LQAIEREINAKLRHGLRKLLIFSSHLWLYPLQAFTVSQCSFRTTPADTRLRSALLVHSFDAAQYQQFQYRVK
jgi:hypothetical protein